MVARKDDAEGQESASREGLFPRVFVTWRALLGRLGTRLGKVVRPNESERSRRRQFVEASAPYIAGAISVAGGAAGAIALGSNGANRAAWVAALSIVVWSLGRLLILELVLHSQITGRRLLQAWSWGLVPYVIAVLPVLTLIAWLMSAPATWWLLQRAGLPRRSATRGVLSAWAAQAVFTLVAGIAVNAWVAFLAFS